MLTITLSKSLLDTKDIGYQAPRAFQEKEEKEVIEEAAEAAEEEVSEEDLEEAIEENVVAEEAIIEIDQSQDKEEMIN